MEYKADIIKYYPEFLRETEEYKAICDAVNPEFDLLWSRLQKSINNILPQTTDLDGIKSYEKWMGIPSDTSLTLEERQAQVIAKLNETLPYTEIRLQRIIAAIVGWGHFTYKRTGALVQIELDEEGIEQYKIVYQSLQRILPMNLHFELTGIPNRETDNLYFNMATLTTETVITLIDNTERIATVLEYDGTSMVTKTIETPLLESKPSSHT